MYAKHLTRITLLISGLMCLIPGAARSTTFVMMEERTLLHSSAAVIIGTVTAIESAVVDDGTIYTYVHVQPERVIKGPLGLDPIVLREPGGTVGDQRQVIFGSPEFWVGERDLLLLSRNRDGTLQTNGLAMGKYTLSVDAEGHTTAERDFGFGASLLVPSTGQLVEARRDTRRFLPLLRRLRRAAHAERRTHVAARPLRLVPEELSNTQTRFQEAFTFLGSPPYRWFQPDTGQPVTYYIDSAGDLKLGFASSQAAIDSAFAAWTNVTTSDLVLQDGGTTSAAPFGPCDMNRITFNDPYNEITDPSACSGILAIGGFCGGIGTTVVNGTTFNQITIGKVTFNNGWGGCSFWNQCNLAEVATHEIGHTIGLGHSSDPTATMYAMAHFDGRCASVMTDDINGVSFIYPQTGTPLPTSTPRATNTPAATRPPAGIPTPTKTWTPAPTRTPTRTARPTSTRVPATATRLPSTTPTTIAPPVNDGCGSATVISLSSYTNTVNTSAATTQASDPTPPCGNGGKGKSIWYQFTAPRNGKVTANTFGSNYDTVLSVYTGTCGSLSNVPAACNDNWSWYSRQSQVTFSAVAGRTYYFMISAGTYGSNGGTAVLHFTFS